MRLRAYLILLVIAALIPVIIFSGISLAKLQEAQRTVALNSIKETARATALTVDRELNGIRSALRVLATSDALLADDLEKFYRKASIANIAREGWVILYDENANQIINTRVPFGTPLPKRGPELDDFGTIQRGNSVHVSGLTWGANVNQHLVLVEMPVEVMSKTYVLSQVVPASYLNLAFTGRGIPPSWVVALFDRNGSTLTRSHGAQQYVGKKPNQDTLDAIQSVYSGVLRHKIRGNYEVYDVFTRSSLSDWVISIGAPVDEIDAAVRQAVVITAAGLLIAILLASTIAWIIGRRILASVDGAVQAAAVIGRGHAMPAIPDSGVHEINQLHLSLVDADKTLEQEKIHRQAAEAERNKLFSSEQKARRLAEGQNQAKDRFLAMLGHELRNPLAAITSAIDIVAIDGDPERSGRALQIISRQGEHLCRIVDDLLDVSRVLSGKVLLAKKQTDLAALVSSCIATLQATGRSQGYEVSVAARSPVWIEADATRMEQVVNNLVDNALKYTPQGGKIHIGLEVQAQEAVLTVQDNGSGIAPELLPTIFDVFVQGEQTLERAQGGLGIGLALVRQLIELHGGSIDCQSDGKNRGSTFTLRLPCSGECTPDDQGKAADSAYNGAHVLLIDDHDDAREMTAAMLKTHGYQVTTAADGTEGIRLFNQVKPELALIDIGLPGMDGYEVARRLRSQAESIGIRLIAVTGYGAAEDRERAIEAGFDLHIVKPLTITKLQKVLKDVAPA